MAKSHWWCYKQGHSQWRLSWYSSLKTRWRIIVVDWRVGYWVSAERSA